MELTYDAFFSMSEHELKDALRSFGVSIFGNREVMITRLVDLVLSGKRPRSQPQQPPQNIQETESDTIPDFSDDSSDDSSENYRRPFKKRAQSPIKNWKEREMDKVVAEIEKIETSTTDKKTTTSGTGIGSLLQQHQNEDSLREKYSKLTVAKLKEIMKKRSVTFSSGSRKSDLISTLVRDSTSKTTTTTASSEISTLQSITSTESIGTTLQIEESTNMYMNDPEFEKQLHELLEMNKDDTLEIALD